MNKGSLEQYKKLIRFAFNIILLICLMGIFIHVWDMNYNDEIVFPFYYKGYLMMGAFYAFFFVIFYNIYRKERKIHGFCRRIREKAYHGGRSR